MCVLVTSSYFLLDPDTIGTSKAKKESLKELLGNIWSHVLPLSSEISFTNKEKCKIESIKQLFRVHLSLLIHITILIK